MATAAEEVRDDLIAQDVRYRRVEAGINRKVQARLNELDRDVKALLVKIDPAGTTQPKARQRRLQKFNREAGVLIRTAYSEINGMVKADLRRVGMAESVNTMKVMRRHIP